MIEVQKTYSLLPGIDKKAYIEYSKRAISTILKAFGIVEIRANRGLLGSPLVSLTTVLETLPDRAKFAESSERLKLEAELLKFATNIDIHIWGPSPVVSEPLRPEK